MPSMEVSIGAAFLAGLLTFLAPCTLPLVPAYLGLISGVSAEELDSPEASVARRRIFYNGVAFILGFSVIFTLFGVLAGLVGSALVDYEMWLARVGGVLIIIFGLFMLGVFKLPFFRQAGSLPIPRWLSPGRPTSSFLIGGTFALGWTPCIGPILGSILLLAGTSGDIVQGGFLLAVFSFGLAIPFLALSAGFAGMSKYIQRISKHLRWVSIVGGVFLIALGLLLVTDQFQLTIQYGYELLEFVNYRELQNYL